MRTEICICTYQRKDKLLALLESIRHSCMRVCDSYWPSGIFICLDGCTDGSLEAVLQIKPDFVVPITCHSQNNRGLAVSRNVCIENSLSERIWFLDDDMLVTERALRIHCSEAAAGEKIVFGPCLIPEKSDAFSLVVKKYYDSRYENLINARGISDPTHFSCANTSGSRSLFKSILFDESFTEYGFEDFEFALRALKMQTELVYLADAKVIHKHDLTRVEVLHTIKGMAVSRVIFQRLHPDFQINRLPGNRGVSLVSKIFILISMPSLSHLIWKCCLGINWWCDRVDSSYSSIAWRFATVLAMSSGIAKSNGRKIYWQMLMASS